ncbi:MAG: hypothetical protein ACH0QD_13495 [Tepidibacillus sp.]
MQRINAIRNTKATKIENDSDLVNADLHTLSGEEFEKLMAMFYRDQSYQVKKMEKSKKISKRIRELYKFSYFLLKIS